MTSPLEYVLLALMTTSQPSPAMVMNNISAASGDPKTQNVAVIDAEGRMTALTVLSTARDPDSETIEAPITFPPEWLGAVDVGLPLSLTVLETGEIYHARIVRLEETIDSSGHHAQGIAEISNHLGHLQPGMMATARLTAPVPLAPLAVAPESISE